MVTGERMTQPARAAQAADAQISAGDPVLRIDGRRPVSAESVTALDAVCDGAEDRGRRTVIIHVSGAPEAVPSNLPIALVSKWERGLRRLERLPAVTIAVADGD